MCAPSPSLFSVGETLVAIDNELPYAAKIEKITEHQGVQKYVVHYIGWKKSQDTKVEVGKEAGILFKGNIKDYVDANRESMNEEFLKVHDRKMEEEEVKKKKEVIPVEEKKNCQWIVGVNGIREEFHWTLEYPDILEQLLMQDKERRKKGFVSKLPPSKTVDEILAAFEKSPESDKFSFAASEDIVRKFNGVFRKLLLSSKERAHYKEFKSSSTAKPSSYYGYIHLIRLVRRLPEFFRTTVYDLEQFNELKFKWQKFVDYLAKHQTDFYDGKNDYQRVK